MKCQCRYGTPGQRYRSGKRRRNSALKAGSTNVKKVPSANKQLLHVAGREMPVDHVRRKVCDKVA